MPPKSGGMEIAMKHYFSKAEWILWLGSLATILLCFFLFGREGYLSLVASLLGVTALIFCAKGHPAGQVMILVFSGMYGYISFSFAYYGEMITYLCMTAPMAVIALVSWLAHPYQGNHAQVSVGRLAGKDWVLLALLTVSVSVVFYFVLAFFHTANLIPSTISVTTSFSAAFLTYKRSPWFALAYAANDMVLIVLWGLASLTDPSYISVLVCFVVFLVNDLYGFWNWRRMGKIQRGEAVSAQCRQETQI